MVGILTLVTVPACALMISLEVTALLSAWTTAVPPAPRILAVKVPGVKPTKVGMAKLSVPVLAPDVIAPGVAGPEAGT